VQFYNPSSLLQKAWGKEEEHKVPHRDHMFKRVGREVELHAPHCVSTERNQLLEKFG